MSDAESIRLVVGEDEPHLRERIMWVLEEAGLEVVGVAGRMCRPSWNFAGGHRLTIKP